MKITFASRRCITLQAWKAGMWSRNVNKVTNVTRLSTSRQFRINAFLRLAAYPGGINPTLADEGETYTW